MPILPFLTEYRIRHLPNQEVGTPDEAFLRKEKVFLSIFGLGLFEVYQFLFSHCKSDEDFEQWIIDLKGYDFYKNAIDQFDALEKMDLTHLEPTHKLKPEQQIFWEKNGYLKLSAIIDAERCNAVIQEMVEIMGIDLNDAKTWYPQLPQLQGLMLQYYQGAAMDMIRNDSAVHQVFSSLYQTNALLPTCEKVSYNPPENDHFKFMGSPLHWDFDSSKGPQYYIQGLIYLNDVPAERGALTLIPGYHHQIQQCLAETPDMETAIRRLRDQNLEIAIGGAQGDLIVWLESLPHAASPNRSNYPRFVQYVSYHPLA